MKNFWKFSKSKNRNFLKVFFGQKNYFDVLLRPNYIDLHSFLTQNRKKKIFDFFRLRIFFQKLNKICEQILWGSSPQNAHTDELKFDILLWPQSWSPLENRMNWKKIELYNVITKSVPEGHCQITSKCTKWIKRLKLWTNWAESAWFRTNSCRGATPAP